MNNKFKHQCSNFFNKYVTFHKLKLFLYDFSKFFFSSQTSFKLNVYLNCNIKL